MVKNVLAVDSLCKPTRDLFFKHLRKPTVCQRWNLEELKGIAREKLSEGVISRLHNAQSMEGNINEQWKILKTAITESAEENIGREKRRKAKKAWVTETMLQKMDERRNWKKVNTEEGRRRYRELNNELRRETDRAREKYWIEQCNEIEDLERAGQMDKMYRKVRELTWKNK